LYSDSRPEGWAPRLVGRGKRVGRTRFRSFDEKMELRGRIRRALKGKYAQILSGETLSDSPLEAPVPDLPGIPAGVKRVGGGSRGERWARGGKLVAPMGLNLDVIKINDHVRTKRKEWTQEIGPPSREVSG